MPIYEYECDKCGARFDAEQSIDDLPKTRCFTCPSRKIHRVPQAIAFRIK